METKYNEALEKAKVWYNELKDSGYIHDSKQLEKIFPELAESEDEKIRKALIKNFTNQHSSNFPTADGFTREQILSWLEKQKERSGLTKDEEFTLNRIIEHFEEEGGYDKWIEVLQDIRNIPYQKEQKPIEWSEEDEKMLNNCIGLLLEIDSTKEERDWLLNLKPQLKHEWTKEDIDHLNSIIGTIVYCKSECPTDKLCQDIYNSDIEWLESLRPQPKQKWSEKDEEKEEI